MTSVLRQIAFLVTAASLSASAFAERAYPATAEQIQYIGRYGSDGDGSATLAFPGQRITVEFSGSSISLDGEVTRGSAYFNARLDGQALDRIDLAEGPFTITLADGLSTTETHQLVLTRRNEAWQGVVRLDRFEIDDGASLLPPPAPSPRRILCIGDSITAGENVDLIPPSTPGLHNANAEAAFGWRIADDFGAQAHIVAYGGKGLVRDWQGLTTEITAPEFFERAVPDDPYSAWNHRQYEPDLILIGLGTNDFSRGIPDQLEWVRAYIEFTNRIHSVHPQAKILLLSGPMFGPQDLKRQVLERYLAEVVAHYEGLGDDFIASHSLNYYAGGELDSHPVRPEHQAMADEIGTTIERWLGWRRE